MVLTFTVTKSLLPIPCHKIINTRLSQGNLAFRLRPAYMALWASVWHSIDTILMPRFYPSTTFKIERGKTGQFTLTDPALVHRTLKLHTLNRRDGGDDAYFIILPPREARCTHSQCSVPNPD